MLNRAYEEPPALLFLYLASSSLYRFQCICVKQREFIDFDIAPHKKRLSIPICAEMPQVFSQHLVFHSIVFHVHHIIFHHSCLTSAAPIVICCSRSNIIRAGINDE